MNHVDIVIVGGGIAGLTTAWRIARDAPGRSVRVLEAGDRVGGTATSEQVDGFTIDRGPNGFLTNVPDSWDLATELGIADEMRSAADAAKKRFVYRNGRLHQLPSTPSKFFFGSKLLNPLEKMRVMTEPLAPPRDPGRDESVFDFAERRLGRGFAEAFMQPMVTGIVAGDARQISLSALFPRMRQLEDEHGGLVAAMLVRGLQAAMGKRANVGGPDGPGGRLTSFAAAGAGRITEALGAQLGACVTTGARVTSIDRADDGYLVHGDGFAPLKARAVVVATPAHATGPLLSPLVPAVQNDIASIPYAGVRVVAMGYRIADLPSPPDGFGFLVPPGQDISILGCLYTSCFFPEQAPSGHVLFRVMAGGTRDPEFVTLDDAEAERRVRADLGRAMGIEADPVLVRHVRWPRAIPQYTVGHEARVARVEALLGRYAPGIVLTGNAWHGVGLNDVVRDARRAATDALRSVG